MFRLLVVCATVVCAIECSNAHAQRRVGRFFRSRGPGVSMKAGGVTRSGYRGPGSRRSSYPSSSFGFSIGIGSYPGYGYSSFGYLDPYRFDGYGYDPYRYGSFKAPDLLDDPYFRARHRFDSHYPGRYRTPLVVRPGLPPASYQSYGSATAHAEDDASRAAPVDPDDLAEQLRTACQQLSRSLSTRRDSDVWREYLAPGQISQLIASGNSAELRELLTHYDGVVGNPQLRFIVALPGFGPTRNLLRQYVSQRIQSTRPRVDQPTIESLPIPEPQAVPGTLPIAPLENFRE